MIISTFLRAALPVPAMLSYSTNNFSRFAYKTFVPIFYMPILKAVKTIVINFIKPIFTCFLPISNFIIRYKSAIVTFQTTIVFIIFTVWSRVAVAIFPTSSYKNIDIMRLFYALLQVLLIEQNMKRHSIMKKHVSYFGYLFH